MRAGGAVGEGVPFAGSQIDQIEEDFMLPTRAQAAVVLSFPLRLRRGSVQLFWIRQRLGGDVLGLFNPVDSPPSAHRLADAMHQHRRRRWEPVAVYPVELSVQRR